MPTPRATATLLALALLASVASAQLDLPDRAGKPRATPQRPAKDRGDVVPHLVCTVCGTRNYTAPRTRPTPEGRFYFAVCAYCRADRRHREGGRGGGGGGGLDLPDRRGSGRPAPKSPALPAAPLFPSAISDQARIVLEEVSKLEAPNASFEQQAVLSLVSMGPNGVLAGRIALFDQSERMIRLGARVLLASGSGAELERVATRLAGALPGHLGPQLLDELVAADPVHASPQYLCGLLEHRSGRMRKAAAGHLEIHLGPALIAPLSDALGSKRTSTRIAVISLLSKIDGPAALGLLLDHIADSSPTVCGKVLDELARRGDARLEIELLQRAFSDRWILRPSAYALLAVLDREDLGRRGILDERHAPSLLAGLESNDPLVAGTCAAALAGIGFRSDDSAATAWLDGRVPAHLISAVSGSKFHTDYASLQPRALRRLELITGEQIGTDGRKWVDWWMVQREDFSALRAQFSIALREVSSLVVRHRSDQGTFSLVGFDAPLSSGPEERIVLGAPQMASLVDSLRELGVLSAERLPGLRGRRSAHEVELSLRVGEREKSFLFGEGEGAEWFTECEELLQAQRERQRWQRFATLRTSQRATWEAEALWWATEQTEAARAMRMKRLVLTHLVQVPPSQRHSGLVELDRVLSIDGVGSHQDLGPIVGLIEEEAFYTERCRRLVRLCRGLIRGDAEAQRRGRERLMDALIETFGDAGAESVAEVLGDMEADQILMLARDERPLMRALVALHYSGSERSEERAVLLAFLDDEDRSVEAAAVSSLGHARLEGARTDLLIRARLAEGIVRLSALEAIGRLGGEGVRQALVTGLAERDGDVQLAALRGLAHLDDPEAVSLFVSYLQQSSSSELFAVAMGALEDLGSAAHEDLLRVANSTLHKARRPAALLLARDGVGAAADPLAVLHLADPDAELALELAILTCFDLREAEDPAAEYIAWLASEADRDAWRWFVEATERRELVCPPRSAFEDEGAGRGPGPALFLLEVVQRCEPFLAERARRELARLLGVELVELTRSAEEREAWLISARALIDRAHPGVGGGE